MREKSTILDTIKKICFHIHNFLDSLFSNIWNEKFKKFWTNQMGRTRNEEWCCWLSEYDRRLYYHKRCVFQTNEMKTLRNSGQTKWLQCNGEVVTFSKGNQLMSTICWHLTISKLAPSYKNIKALAAAFHISPVIAYHILIMIMTLIIT